MIDLETTLQKVRDNQWALADFDWDAPGADRIRPDQFDALKEFMGNLVWIEHIGARGFAALADKADDPMLAELYEWFHAEEQRHANAELALMKRWGMVEDGEIPDVDTSLRVVVEWLDGNARTMPLGGLSTLIAVLEVALDGALVAFLLDEVDDPLCHKVFARINADESRHLAVDFHVMEVLGMRPWARETIRLAASVVNPRLLLGILLFIPVISRVRDNVVRMGLDEERLNRAIRRFDEIGSRSPYTRRYPPFQVLRRHARLVVNRTQPYSRVADGLGTLTSRIPTRVLGPLPGWVENLTSEPTA